MIPHQHIGKDIDLKALRRLSERFQEKRTILIIAENILLIVPPGKEHGIMPHHIRFAMHVP